MKTYIVALLWCALGSVAYSAPPVRPGAQTYAGTVNNLESPGVADMNLTLSASGKYTASVFLGIRTYRFRGSVGADGKTTLEFPTAARSKLVIDTTGDGTSLPVDTSAPGLDPGTWYLFPHAGTELRSAPGRYVVNLDRGFQGRISAAGLGRFIGTSRDGVRVTFSGLVVKDAFNDIFRLSFHARTGGKKFMIGGLLIYAGYGDASDFAAVRGWSYFAFGILPDGSWDTGDTEYGGGKYTPASRNQRPYEIQRDGAAVPGDLTFDFYLGRPGWESGVALQFTWSPTNRIKFASNELKPVLTVNPATGLVTGSIELEPGRKTRLYGVLDPSVYTFSGMAIYPDGVVGLYSYRRSLE